MLRGVKREGDSSGALLSPTRCGPGPGKEFVEAIGWPEIYQPNQDIGEPSMRVNAGQFGCFNERGEHGPIFSAVIVTREESVLARQSHCPFILPMSGRNLKSITAGIPILAAGSASGRSRSALTVAMFG